MTWERSSQPGDSADSPFLSSQRANSNLPDYALVQARALEWVSASGVQVEGIGACYAWYDEVECKFSFIYPEITAYYITTCCFFSRVTGDPRWMRQANLAAEWLSRIVIHSHAMVPAKIGTTETSGLVYSFDLAMILHALQNFLQYSGSAQCFTAARMIADWLTHRAFRDSGAFWPAWDMKGGRFLELPAQWSLYSGSYQTKIGLALLLFHRVVGTGDYPAVAEKVAARVCDEQGHDGRLPTFPNGDVNSHPHCYGAEGLWGIGTILGSKRFIQASERATGWLTSMASPDGALPRGLYGGRPSEAERADVLAQCLRLNEIHRATQDVDDGYTRSRLAKHLVDFQSTSRDKRSGGGFLFGRLSSGPEVRHVNSWTTFFACQALYLYSHPDASLEPGDLV